MEIDDPGATQEQGLTPDQGGGPPIGSAWTFEVEGESGWSADLEHAAPLPRVGERIEFIGEDGRRQIFRVTDVIHTLQASASERPPVSAEQSGPNSIVTDQPDQEAPRALRAGLPRVVVVASD
ncbi:MAG TPA: hypothetical protein VEW95_07750 [Candidatus Limnocylindrales bacterium]|nr:hypothetical protein [Candidatus Limnocylindrales bacterium]